MFKKLKSLIADDSLYAASLLVLVGIASFGLGRLSVTPIDPEGAPATVVRTMVEPPATSGQPKPPATSSPEVQPVVLAETATIVASKAGTKYHKVTCPGAKQIKPENKIYFESPEAAKAAGYTAAANCPGL